MVFMEGLRGYGSVCWVLESCLTDCVVFIVLFLVCLIVVVRSWTYLLLVEGLCLRLRELIHVFLKRIDRMRHRKLDCILGLFLGFR